MTDLPPLKVWEASDATWEMVGQVGGYTSLTVEHRHSQPGTWSLTMPYSTQAALLTRTCVVTFDFRGERFTGLVESVAPQSDEKGQPILVVGGQGALALLSDPLCYPEPAKGAAAQLVTHYRDSGPAETVLRDLIVAQYVNRQGHPLSIPASEGRGKQVKVNLFFDNLLEVVMKKAASGGLGLRMGLVNTTSNTRAKMELTFVTGEDRSSRVRLSHKVGTLRSWKGEVAVPTATRAVIGAAIKERPTVLSSINVDNDTLTVDGPHGLKTGSMLRFSGDALPEPLDDGTAYFAVRVDSNTFKVARSRAKALDGTVVNLTDVGGQEVSAVNVTNDTLSVASGSLPKTGAAFKLLGPGTVPPPLDKGTVYYAIRMDRDTIKVATSATAADNGNAVNLTGAGSGKFNIFPMRGLKVVEVARVIGEYVRDGLEESWGRQREVFVDARSEDSDDTEVFTVKGEEALEEVSQSSFELEAAEAEGMRLFEHYGVSDFVTVELLTGLSSVERLTAVRVEVGGEGVKVTLIPGNPDGSNPMFKTSALIRSQNRRIRNLEQEES